jgi:hypothetical protein
MCVLGGGGGGGGGGERERERERERKNWEINGVWPNYTNFWQLISTKKTKSFCFVFLIVIEKVRDKQEFL